MPFFKETLCFWGKRRIKNPSDLILSVLVNKVPGFLGQKGWKSLGLFYKKCFLGQKNEKEPNLFFWSKSLHTGPNCLGPNVVFLLLKKKLHFCQYFPKTNMFQKTDFIHIFILMAYIDFYVKFSKWDHNCLVITARSIDCLANNVTQGYQDTELQWVFHRSQWHLILFAFYALFL